MPAIASSHRAIAYSRRYCRPNEQIEPGADNPLPRHADDLAAFLRAVGAAPAHLVGSSLGAFVSLVAAIRHPEVVRTLVLAEPPVVTLFVSAQPRPSELLSLLARRPRTGMAVVRFGAGTLGPAQKAFERDRDEDAMTVFGRGVLGRERFEQLPAERRAQAEENLVTLKAALLGSGLPPLDAADVRGIQVPVLLVTGAESPAIFRRLSEHLAELLPRAESVEIPQASHMMFEERPDAVNEAILGFLARHREDATAGAPA